MELGKEEGLSALCGIGFGTFSVAERSQREGRNPRT
ncbi:MAG: HU family DNA-binding protein [Syntrophobacteraceae bacterium]